LFVVAPDVVANADITRELYDQWRPRLLPYGFPIAYVAQDGATIDTLPWDDMDVLFLGGSTEFKLSATMRQLAEEAYRRRIPIHAGRVNSYKRLRWAKQIHARTTDGTFISKFPDIGYAAMSSFLTRVNAQGELPL
jgi:hypothetical protein